MRGCITAGFSQPLIRFRRLCGSRVQISQLSPFEKVFPFGSFVVSHTDTLNTTQHNTLALFFLFVRKS